MIQIPVVRTATPEGELIAPTHPFPAEHIAIRCDGETYTVYEPGDTVPPLPAPTDPA